MSVVLNLPVGDFNAQTRNGRQYLKPRATKISKELFVGVWVTAAG